MNLTELLEMAGGAQSLGKLAGNLGIDASKANELVSANNALKLTRKFF